MPPSLHSAASHADPGDRVLPDHVEQLSPALAVSFHDSWYEAIDGRHFWMEWRWRAFERMLRRPGGPKPGAPLRAIDIGGGHGVLRDQMERHSRWEVDLVDVNPVALAASRRGRGRTLLYDVTDERPELLGQYDIATLFDVIEHLEDPAPVLRSAVRHLRPGGWLAINVPALQSLYSTYDIIIGHYRRYDRRRMAADIAAADLPIAASEMRYWGGSMLPLLALRTAMMGRKKPSDDAAIAKLVEKGLTPPSRLADMGLRAMMWGETALPFSPPLGTSLMALYQIQGESAEMR